MTSSLIARIVSTVAFISIIYTAMVQTPSEIIGNPIFLWALATSIFIFPSLLSRITTKSYFGFGYILATLLYPIIYGIGLYINTQFGTPMQEYYHFASIAVVILTCALVLIITYISKKDKNREMLNAILGFIVVAMIITGINRSLNIESNSVLSLDFLQHNAVVMEMSEGRVCITPNECTNLFQKLGYTTYFHTIQALITLGNTANIAEIFIILSTTFTAFSAILISRILSRVSKNKLLIAVGALTAVLVFDLGAHSFTYFLPQTFALILFLNAILETKFRWWQIILTGSIIILSHFVIGTYLFVLFILLTFLFNNKVEDKYQKILIMLGIVGVLITYFANLRGFSIEKVFQTAEIDALGFLSNYYHPDNLIYIVRQYGLLAILALVSVIYSLFSKTLPMVRFSTFIILSGLTVYFLAPTYSNKFFIGFTPFLIVLLIHFVETIFKKGYIKFLILELVLISTIPLYLINAQKYMTFYTQGNGTISAIVSTDRPIIDFLAQSDLDCLIVSDPYTQLIIRSKTGYETLNGQYQSLKEREIISNFVQSPSDSTYNELELLGPKDHTCFLYSSRLSLLNKYANPDNAPWRNILYDYEINNNRGLENSQGVQDYLNKEGYEISYIDSNFILFSR